MCVEVLFMVSFSSVSSGHCTFILQLGMVHKNPHIEIVNFEQIFLRQNFVLGEGGNICSTQDRDIDTDCFLSRVRALQSPLMHSPPLL